MSWYLFSSFSDPSGDWLEETLMYDNNTSTRGYCLKTSIPNDSWGEFVYLIRSGLQSKKLRMYIDQFEAGEYQIDIDVLRDGSWANVYQGNVSDYTYTEKTFTAGVVTQVRIRIYRPAAVGWSARLWEIQLECVIPTAPSGCAAQYVATNNAKCTWNDNSDNEDGFRIERNIDDGGWVFWKNVAENIEDSGNYNVGANHKIQFRVQAYNTEGSSAWSTSGACYTIPTIPSGLSLAWEVQDETVRVSYTKNHAYGDIDIYKETDGEGTAHLAYDAVSPYDDATPTGVGHVYAYKIRARSIQHEDSSYTYSAFTAEEEIESTPLGNSVLFGCNF